MRLANLGLGCIVSLQNNQERIRSCRYGEVVLQGPDQVTIYPRWWPRIASQWDVVRDDYVRTLAAGECRFFYSFPWSSPGFMTLNYGVTGPATRYETIRRAVGVADEIAKIKKAKAIVCQAFNKRVSEAIMNRWGYVRHAASLGDNHYIKRFND